MCGGEMEKQESLKQIRRLSEEWNEIAREQVQIRQIDEFLSCQEKKDKSLYDEMSYKFTGDRTMQRLCSSYQEISEAASIKRKRCIDEYDENVKRQKNRIEEEKCRIRQE